MITYATEDNFISLTNKGVCLVDFYATWCGPCRMLAVELEDAEAENEDINIVKVNIDECMNLAKKYKIQVVPTIIVFKDGKLVKQIEGFMQKDDILHLVNSI